MVDNSLASGERYQQQIVITEWIEFAEVGQYNLSVTYQGRVQPGVVASRHHTLSIRVLPRDVGRLQQRCADLLREASDAQSDEARIAAAALASVRDSVAVPFLVALAERDYWVGIAVGGLERIGSSEARRGLERLATSPKRDTADLAGDALRRIRG
jgi:hypothetical protein